VNCASVIATLPPAVTFKRLLLLFWAVYFSIVALTNVVSLLDELSAIHWTFLDSGNFDYMYSVTKVYEVGTGVTKILFVGAIAIELVGAVLFWRAFLTFRDAVAGRVAAFQALSWGTLVWVAFILMAEFFIGYDAEPSLRELLVIMIASALAIALIPDD
jgi:hypothetical protein